MDYYPTLKCAYTDVELMSKYHKRNTWVLFAYIPIVLLFYFTVGELKPMVMTNIMMSVTQLMFICFIQGFAYNFFDGLIGLIPNTLFIYSSIIGHIVELNGMLWFGLAYGYLCLMLIFTIKEQSNVLELLISFLAVSAIAYQYALLFCCMFMIYLSSPARVKLLKFFGTKSFWVLIMIIPIFIAGGYAFMITDKFIYVPSAVLLISTAYYFRKFLKKRNAATDFDRG